MSTVYLFTGENAHLLREERRRWIDEFSKKHGEENITRLDGKHLSVRSLLDDIAVMPFLAERRLVIVDGIPKSSKEEIQTIFAHIHPQTILLFADAKPDKRLAGVKELLAHAEVKTFMPLKGKALLAWIKTTSAALGMRLDDDAVSTLIELLGEDQSMIAHELEKLSLFAAGKPLSRADIEEMTIPSDEGVVWRLTDLLCEGRRTKAATFARMHIERGGDAYGLWAIVLSMLRNAVLVKAAVEDGERNPKAISEKTGVHVFALRSLQPYASRVDGDRLKTFVQWAANADIDLKTGALRSTDEAPQELHALLDRFILTSP